MRLVCASELLRTCCRWRRRRRAQRACSYQTRALPAAAVAIASERQTIDCEAARDTIAYLIAHNERPVRLDYCHVEHMHMCEYQELQRSSRLDEIAAMKHMVECL